jgi:hypothetical protein
LWNQACRSIIYNRPFAPFFLPSLQKPGAATRSNRFPLQYREKNVKKRGRKTERKKEEEVVEEEEEK